MKIYVASSWRNDFQPHIVASLRQAGHEVYDFRNPQEDNKGFSWSEIDSDWQGWDIKKYRDLLDDPIAQKGFELDWDAMLWADCCVLVLPCGRSAHIEAGYFVGAGKQLHILLHNTGFESELMYKMATGIHVSIYEVLKALKQ